MKQLLLKKIHPFLFYVIFVFLLNFTWEALHAPYLYVPHPFSMHFWPMIFYAASIDAIILFFMLLVGALVWRNKEWFAVMDYKKYLYFIITAIAAAVFMEVRAVYFLHSWSYSNLMPIVFGVGLSPLTQLALTGLLSIWLVRVLRQS